VRDVDGQAAVLSRIVPRLGPALSCVSRGRSVRSYRKPGPGQEVDLCQLCRAFALLWSKLKPLIDALEGTSAPPQDAPDAAFRAARTPQTGVRRKTCRAAGADQIDRLKSENFEERTEAAFEWPGSCSSGGAKRCRSRCSARPRMRPRHFGSLLGWVDMRRDDRLDDGNDISCKRSQSTGRRRRDGSGRGPYQRRRSQRRATC